MARLGLIAVLLVALAPAVSRWVASGQMQLLPGLTELCTVEGLRQVLVPGSADADVPAPHHSGMQEDCAYCPLLAGVALLLLVLTWLAPRARADLVPHARSLPSGLALFFPGLGSRGPPLAL